MSFGRPYILRVDGCIHDGWLALSFDRGQIGEEFLYYLLSSPVVFKEFENKAAGSAVKNLNKELVSSVRVVLPPFDEQQRIAEIISTWDRAIKTTEALLANARTQKRALMQSLFMGKCRFPEFAGQDWKEVQMGNVAEVDVESLDAKTPDNFAFDYISLSNVEPGRVVKPLERMIFCDAPSRARRKVQAGDLLVSTVRPNLLGFARISDDYANCIASTGFAVVSCSNAADGSYLFHYLFSHHMRSQFHALVVGSNYPAINSTDVKKLRLQLPSIEEQRRIGKLLDDCDVEITALVYYIHKLCTEKKALMQQLLTGKQRVMIDSDVDSIIEESTAHD